LEEAEERRKAKIKEMKKKREAARLKSHNECATEKSQ